MVTTRENKPVAARDSATERVTSGIRKLIVSLEFAPGVLLDKAALTARFGVSRFPVAEALKRLEAEGLVEIRPQSGTRVSLIRLSDIHENLVMRRALEAEVVERLAKHPSAELIADLRRNLRYQKAAVEAEDRIGFSELDLVFHDLLIDALDFPRIRIVIDTARFALDRVRRLLVSPRRHALTLEEHGKIVDAIESGDPVAARRAMREHVDAVLEDLREFSSECPEVFSDA